MFNANFELRGDVPVPHFVPGETYVENYIATRGAVNTSPRFVPRLSLSYDVQGNGANIIHATYGQYSGRYSEAQVSGDSPVGSPATISRYYTGPECIGDETACASGFNLANYPIPPANLERAEVPLANIFVDPKLKTPLTHEFTASFGRALGADRGHAEASYIFRRTANMVEDFTPR